MNVQLHRLSRYERWKAVAVGFATGAILALLNVIALKSHLSPLPEPLGLAFAETLFGRQLPLPVGLLFHLAWVTFFCIAYVALWRDRLTLRSAVMLSAVLWLMAVAVFFPIVGWGFFGLKVSAKLIIPVTVSHALFAAILWGLARIAFGQALPRQGAQPKAA